MQAVTAITFAWTSENNLKYGSSICPLLGTATIAICRSLGWDSCGSAGASKAVVLNLCGHDPFGGASHIYLEVRHLHYNL